MTANSCQSGPRPTCHNLIPISLNFTAAPQTSKSQNAQKTPFKINSTQTMQTT
jgi:hypothetical protein